MALEDFIPLSPPGAGRYPDFPEKLANPGTVRHIAPADPQIGRGLITPTKGGLSAPSKHSSTHAVEEAYGYVQGASLKPYAAFPWSAYQLPDHQVGGQQWNVGNLQTDCGGTPSRPAMAITADMEKANGKLQSLLALWQEKRGARPMPSRSDLPVTALRPWLGNLALIDLTGTVPYFRLCGTGLRTRFGGEMTGQKLDAVQDAHGRNELRRCIEQSRQTLKPAPMVHEVRADNGKTVFHELCLPLGRDAKQPDTVLFASYAEQKR